MSSEKKFKSQSTPLLLFLNIIITSILVLATNTFFESFSVSKQIEIEVWANTWLELKYNDKTLNAKLFLDNGTVVSSQPIKFFANESFLGENLTDERGIATIHFSTPGSWKIKVLFEGNEEFYLNPSFLEKEIVIEEQVKVFTETFIDLNIENKTIFATLLLDNGSFIPNQEIEFYVDDKFVGSNSTDEFGVATFSFDFENVSKIKAVFKGSEELYFNPSEREVLIEKFVEEKTEEKEVGEFISPQIEASVFVSNVTKEKGKSELRFVAIYGKVKLNESLIPSKVKLKVFDDKQKVVFEGEDFVNGNFNFTFEISPKSHGKHFAEIFVESEFGNSSKTIEFNVLKHLKIKPKIKREKFNYGIGEKIRFEILAIDEDSGEIFPNANLKVFVVDPEGNITEVNFVEDEVEKGKFYVELDAEREFRPGLYKLKVKLSYVSPNPGEIEVEEEVSFAVGLININTPKSIYSLGENATIIVGVLNKEGHRIPDASVMIKIVTPSGNVEEFSTFDKILSNGDGTYTLNYIPKEIGVYKVNANAVWEDLDVSYETIFEVRGSIEFDILRSSETLIEYDDPVKMRIEVTPFINSSFVNIIEQIPNELEIVSTNGNLIITPNGTFIFWNFTDLKSKAILEYVYKAPRISPMLYLIGPLQINYIENEEIKNFTEIRPWSIGVDVIFYYYVKWTWRWRDTNNVIDTTTDTYYLCRGEYYNLSLQVVDAAFDSRSASQVLRLQLLPEGESNYNNLPYAGWTYWGGDTNDHTVASELGNDALTCRNGAIDACYFDRRLINITSDTQIKSYKLKLTSSVYPGAFRFGTNIINVRVIDCSGVNLVRDIKIYSPTGEDGKIIRGHMGFIAVPLANYNTSQTISGNVTVTLLDGDTPLNWFFWDNKTRPFSLPPTSEPPYWSESVLTWRFEVPEDIPQKTYTLKVEINQTNQPTLIYTKNFDIYQSEEGNLAPLIIFTTYPYRGTGDSGSRNYQRVSVCNYGDYNLTVNITILPSGQSQTAAPTIIEGPAGDVVTATQVSWYLREIPTSSCFNATIQWVGPEEASADGQFYTEVVWIDPVSGTSQTISKTDNFISANSAAGHSGSPDPFFDIYEVHENSSATITYAIRTGSGVAGYVYVIDLLIPPGFNITRSSFSGSYIPDPGYPIGSIYEGYIVRYSGLGAFPTGYITTSTTIGATVSISSIATNTGSVMQFAPGGKPWYQNILGEGARNKAEWWTKNKRTITLLGPWIKTIRYYNAGSGLTQGFPTSFECGLFNVSLQIFNKGNLPLLNSNVTENKENVIVTHLGDLYYNNFNPTPSYYNSSIINWDGSINFASYGKLLANFYNYTINVPYQTNGTFRFQAIPTNGTFVFLDEPYDIFIACGAILSVTQPTFSPLSPLVNQPFNVSSTITNYGPGNANNVIAIINYTGPGILEIRNASGDLSDVNYIGTIELNGAREAKWNITASTAGTYTICIRANATENSTEVMSCNDVLVALPPAIIEMENPLVISRETGTSTGSWGFNFDFNVSVRVSNSENDVQVCSYFSKTGLEPWRLVGCDNYPAPGSGNVGQWINFSFEFDADCSDIGSPVFVKFNATNFAGTTNSTSTSFTITKNTIFFEDITGNGTETRRGKQQRCLL